MKKKFIYFILFLFPAMYSCLDTPNMTVGIANMKIEPTAASGVTSSSSDGALTLTGTVVSVGKIEKLFEKGFYWGYDRKNLTDSVLVEDNNSQPGTFFGTLSNIRGDTTIYWQAFARNDYGISLGDTISYTTPPIFTNNVGNTFSGKLRSYYTSFSLKNDFYFTCGNRNNLFFNDIYRFDGTRWWYDIDTISGARGYPVAFTINDSLAYVGTGYGPGGIVFGDFYVFNGNTHSWNGTPIQTPAEMPRYNAVAFGLNNKGYVVGGNTGNGISKDVWEYSIANGIDTWRKMNDFPYPFFGGLSFSNNERVFVGFGNDNTVDSLWEYNIATDSWKVFASSPTNSQGEQAVILSGVITNDKIYLLDVTNIIWELDLTTGKYKQKSKLPDDLPVRQHMFSVGGAIYVGLDETTGLFYRYYPLWDN